MPGFLNLELFLSHNLLYLEGFYASKGATFPHLLRLSPPLPKLLMEPIGQHAGAGTGGCGVHPSTSITGCNPGCPYGSVPTADLLFWAVNLRLIAAWVGFALRHDKT